MTNLLVPPRGPGRPAPVRRRPAGARRRLAAPLVGLSFTAALLLVTPVAGADTSSTLTVVGTSDVSDSGLMANLIQPGFQAAFPQFTFKYIGTGTGAAINNAETGAGGASVLIVHAASLENQFVGSGFSEEPYGRAIFTNDFVLAGPASSPDPAGVTANAGHDIVQAFADVAVAGAAGNVEFVSRGGTPGTTVAEHQVWALVAGMTSPPASLHLCKVSAQNGGGETPTKTGPPVTTSDPACPTPTVTPPPWYATTGLTQGPNIQNADVCNYPSLGAGKCYVFTDRGTYAFLASGTDPAGKLANLGIVTRQNSATAPGGGGELVNYFHAYVINPAKFSGQPNVSLNVPAAVDFVNYITSPGFQAQLKNYLGGANDPPFVADASPLITDSGIPGVANAGTRVAVSGSVTNAEPFFPALANVPVTVSELEGGLPVPVASATTDGNGNYSVGFVPTSTGSFQVSTGLISQIENPNLSPAFGDLLQPAASAAVALSVQGAVSIASAKPTGGGVVVSGSVAPGSPHANATVNILARHQGSSTAFIPVGGARLAASQSSYAIMAALPPGAYQVEASFQDPGAVLGATTAAVNVTVTSKGSRSVRFVKRTVKRGALTVAGRLSPAPTAKGAYVALLGRHTALGRTSKAKGKTLHRIAKLSVASGKTSFTIRAKLARGNRWVLQLEYVQHGQKTAFSALSSLNVH